MDHSLETLFSNMYKEVLDGSSRYEVMDRDHIMDTKLGVEYHLYDDGFRITKNGMEMLPGDATSNERNLLYKMKQALNRHFDHEQKEGAAELRRQLYGMAEAGHSEMMEGTPKPKRQGY